MQSQVHEIDPVTVELKVQWPWDRVRKGLETSFGKLQKTARVRGFRPGKVPRPVLQKLFGRQVKSEVAATLMEQGLIEAVQQHELPIVASPRVDSLPSITEGEPLSFSAKIEIRPKIGAIETGGIEVQRPRGDVADEQIAEELERLRERHSEIVTPDPARTSKEGDLVTIDYRAEVEGEAKPEMTATERVVELGAGRLLPALDEGLRGLLPDQEKTISVTYGDESPNEALKGKTATFYVKVREVREKVKPALDDDFAKDVGSDTLDDLKNKIRGDLAKAAESRAKSAVREQLIDKLVEKNPVPVPPSLVAQQGEAMRREMMAFVRMLGQAGQSLPPELMNMHEQAEKKVRAAILLGELARQREISISNEEVEARLAEIAEQTGKHIAKVRVEHSGEKRDSLESKLLEEKLLEYLLSQATVTDAPPEPTEKSQDE